MHKINST